MSVDAFWLDERDVTNEQFAAFVAATHYVTTAERAPSWEEYKAQLPPGTPEPAAETISAPHDRMLIIVKRRML